MMNISPNLSQTELNSIAMGHQYFPASPDVYPRQAYGSVCLCVLFENGHRRLFRYKFDYR